MTDKPPTRAEIEELLEWLDQDVIAVRSLLLRVRELEARLRLCAEKKEPR